MIEATITELHPCGAQPTRVLARIKGLEAEARKLALDERDAILTEVSALAVRIKELATVESLPPGIRDAFRTMADRYAADVQTVHAIAQRVG